MKLEDILIKQTVSNRGIITNDYVTIDTHQSIKELGPNESYRYITPSDFVFDSGYAEAAQLSNNRLCKVWLMPNQEPTIYCSKGEFSNTTNCLEHLGVRPKIDIKIDAVLEEFSPLGVYILNKIKGEILFNNLVYPQEQCSSSLCEQLNRAKKDNQIIFTGRSFLIDSESKVNIAEVLYNNARYVEFANKWYHVSPIVWKIENWKDMPSSLNPIKDRWWKEENAAKVMELRCVNGLIFLPFNNEYNLMHSANIYEWQNSNVRAYLNSLNLHKDIQAGNGDPTKLCTKNINFEGNGFLEQMFIQDKVLISKWEENKEKKILINKQMKKLAEKEASPYSVTVDNTPLTATEQMKFYLETGKNFMLHGPSGVGKSRRVKELDPDCVCLQLRNGILPEEIIGKTGSEGKETFWIEPTWYTRLKELCENDPKHNHILFIDEITNVRPSEQSLVFHIVLEHSIDGNIGKLPKNCIVVAAGNSPEESEAAYNMPEPLFRRFAGHIYLDIDIESFIEWGSEKRADGLTKIHPLVSLFIAEKGKKVFYSKYDPENPPKFTLDPRGWEQVSSIIYANNNTLSIKLLSDKLGTKVANELISFAKRANFLTLKDILSGNYIGKIPFSTEGKDFLVCNLRYTDKKDVGSVRQFIKKHLGQDRLEKFDRLWIDGQQDKKDYLDKLDAEQEEQRLREEERRLKEEELERERREKEEQEKIKNKQKEEDFFNLLDDTFSTDYLKKVQKIIDKYKNAPNLPEKFIFDFLDTAESTVLTNDQLSRFVMLFDFISHYKNRISDEQFTTILDAFNDTSLSSKEFYDYLRNIIFKIRRKGDDCNEMEM